MSVALVILSRWTAQVPTYFLKMFLNLLYILVQQDVVRNNENKI